MSWQEYTALFILAVFVGVIGYDLFAYVRWGNEATISRVCLETANHYRGFAILAAFAVGVLFGHLFLPQHIATSP